MTVDKAQLDMLLAVINYLLVNGIKDLAEWAHFKIAGLMTTVLAGLVSAALLSAVTIYGMGQALTLGDFLNWFTIFASSLGIYRAITAAANAQAQALAAALPAAPVPVINVTVPPGAADPAMAPLAALAGDPVQPGRKPGRAS